VNLGGKNVGLFDQAKVSPGKVAIQLFQNIVEANHKKSLKLKVSKF
jgi:hypothetical protein